MHKVLTFWYVCWPLVVLLSLLPRNAVGQTDIELILQRDSLAKYRPEDRFDHSYLQDETGYLTPRLFLVQDNQPITVNVAGQRFANLSYEPNQAFGIGGGLFYRWFGLQLSFPIQAFSAPEGSRGYTRSFVLNVNGYLRRYGFDVYYTRYNGFYLSNPQQVIPTQPTPPFPIRSDLRSESIGGNFVFVFNHRRFSFRAAFIQTERQLKSAGSLLLQPTFNYIRFAGDSALTAVGGVKYAGVPTGIGLRSGISASAGVNFGYAQTFVVNKRFFFLVALLPGITVGTHSYTLDDDVERRSERFNVRAHFRASLGYNGERWFGGLAATADAYNIRLTRDVSVGYIIARTQLFFGRRFEMLKMKK
jgi:hypothetical protein